MAATVAAGCSSISQWPDLGITSSDIRCGGAHTALCQLTDYLAKHRLQTETATSCRHALYKAKRQLPQRHLRQRDCG